jgi:hypothetical protein
MGRWEGRFSLFPLVGLIFYKKTIAATIGATNGP